MITRVLGPLLGRRTELPESIGGADGRVVLRHGRWLPALAGRLAGMRTRAAAVTIGDTIVVHPEANLSDRLLRHELEHVRQWSRQPLTFPLRYVLAHVRHGYRDNPYERSARAAERD